ILKVKEDITGNSDGIPTTADEINAIRGVSDAIKGIDYTVALINGEYINPKNPTVAEIQEIITTENSIVNASNEGFTELVEDIAGNVNGISITANEINSIMGVSGAIEDIDYSKALVTGTYADSENPTVEEIQAIVDSVNAINEVIEDIAGNENDITVTAEQINAIIGVSGAIEDIDYSKALATGTYADSENPTVEEIQAIVDSVNAINEVIEDITGNENDITVTAEQINAIIGVSGAISGIDYSDELQNGIYDDSENPTAEEIQFIIDSVNNASNRAVEDIIGNTSNRALSEIIEDISGNINGRAVTAKQINEIIGVTGAISGVDYSEALENGNYADSDNPTIEEIQAVIDEVNSKLNKIKPIKYSLGGEEEDPENVYHESIIIDIPIDENINETSLKLIGADENGELIIKGEGIWHLEDGEIIFTPEDDFIYDPTPIKYTAIKEDGTQFLPQKVEVHFPGLLRDDIKVSSNLKKKVILEVLKNDNGDLNISTLRISVPEEFMDEHPGTVFEKSLAKSGKVLKVPNEGIWRVKDNGTISYQPLTDNEPTPIQYRIYDNAAKKILKSAKVIIKKTVVKGVSIERNQTLDVSDISDINNVHKSKSVSSLSKLGLMLIGILGSILGLLLFRKEKI
ncbi:MAG: hypothetical protein KAU90_11450, partial [Sulfurovaceae bacterium]|nr:hypothetical protein [Sulfurovaceae bacterium]